MLLIKQISIRILKQFIVLTRNEFSKGYFTNHLNDQDHNVLKYNLIYE